MKKKNQDHRENMLRNISIKIIGTNKNKWLIAWFLKQHLYLVSKVSSSQKAACSFYETHFTEVQISAFL